MEPTFKYVFERSYVPTVGNQQWIFKFPNGYNASVIRGKYTYGGDQGLFELAVLDKDFHLDYSTEITNDVIGNLTVAQVDELCDRIAQLQPRPPKWNASKSPVLLGTGKPGGVKDGSRLG